MLIQGGRLHVWEVVLFAVLLISYDVIKKWHVFLRNIVFKFHWHLVIMQPWNILKTVLCNTLEKKMNSNLCLQFKVMSMFQSSMCYLLCLVCGLIIYIAFVLLLSLLNVVTNYENPFFDSIHHRTPRASWNTSVGIATDYSLDCNEIRVQLSTKIWSFSHLHRI